VVKKVPATVVAGAGVMVEFQSSVPIRFHIRLREGNVTTALAIQGKVHLKSEITKVTFY